MKSKITSFIRPENLNDLARDLGLGAYASRGGTVPDTLAGSSPTNFSLRKNGNNYVFSHLPGISGDVTLLTAMFDNGSQKNHDQWRDFSSSNTNGIVIPNSKVIYQMARCLYHLRDDDQHKDIVQECTNMLREDWKNRIPHTGTKITYGSGLEATIHHLQPDKSTSDVVLDIPEFTRYDQNWSYLVLAAEQAELQLGTVNEIPEYANLVLHALLGEGYEQVGEVFQYLAPRRNNGALREVRLWTPTMSNRNAERAVVLGVGSGSGGRFGILADVDVGNHWPARGVVVSTGR